MGDHAAAILAFRVAAQGLAQRAGSQLDVTAGWAVQDSPPGAAALALHARSDEPTPAALAGALREERTLLRLYNPRSAVAMIPSADVERFCAALRPRDEASLRQLVGRAVPDEAMADDEAVDLAVAAVADALDGRVLSRDELHEELRVRLPAALLPWCPGCGSHHARRGLLNAATLHGVLCHAGARDRQAAFARTDQWLGRPLAEVDADAATAELVRRYLRWYGPSTPTLFAEWAGVARGHATAAWALVDAELAPFGEDGRRRTWLLEADLPRLREPLPATGIRLLPPGDPLLQARDKELLVPDPVRRKQIWSAIGGPGLVLSDGRPVASWRPRKQGRRFVVRVEPFGALRHDEHMALEVEAEAVAAHRAATDVSVELAA